MDIRAASYIKRTTPTEKYIITDIDVSTITLSLYESSFAFPKNERLFFNTRQEFRQKMEREMHTVEGAKNKMHKYITVRVQK